MHLNQLKKPALEAFAKEKAAYNASRKLRQVGERKRKIDHLKIKLAQWGIDVTYWRYTQFKIGDILFVIRENKSRYELVARKKCKSCKAICDSLVIGNLLDLGRMLATEYGWAYHACPPKRQPIVPPPLTIEQRAFNLIKELLDLVTNQSITERL